MTTAGSLALVGSRPPRDATATHKLRQAGAIFWVKPICPSGRISARPFIEWLEWCRTARPESV